MPNILERVEVTHLFLECNARWESPFNREENEADFLIKYNVENKRQKIVD